MKPIASTVLLALLVLVSRPAHGDCGPLAIRQRVVVQQHHAAAVVAVPQVSYFVGAPVRVESLIQQALQADPEYQAFRRWRLQGPQATQDQQAPQREAIKVEANPFPLLHAKCARCHSGDSPRGGVTLDGSQPISPEVALKSLRFLRDRRGPEQMAAVLSGLKDADLPQLMDELLEASKTR